MPTVQIKRGAVVVGSDAVNDILKRGIELFRLVGAECVVTAGVEGTHTPASKHYELRALDFRTRHLTLSQVEEMKRSQEAYFPDKEFDVIWHSTHLHVEKDPR